MSSINVTSDVILVKSKGDTITQTKQKDGLHQINSAEQNAGQQFQCPFAIHFCQVKGSKERIKKHLRDDRISHLVLLCKSINHLRNVRDITLINNVENFEFLENKMSITRCIMNRFNSQHIFHVSKIEKQIKKSLRSPHEDEIIGQPFETNRFGYKVIPIIAPYADKETQQEYLSVSVALIKGDYDAILKWPFDFSIKFAVVTRKAIFEKHVAPQFPRDQEKLKRPFNQRNKAFGIKNFILLNEIENFTVNNDFFIKITIEIAERRCNF